MINESYLAQFITCLSLRLVMLVLESWAGNSTLGIEGVLFMADVALAAGAKLEVDKCKGCLYLVAIASLESVMQVSQSVIFVKICHKDKNIFTFSPVSKVSKIECNVT